MTHISQTEIRRLDFTLLLVMRGLLRHRRTTAVAAELGLSQSAISYALARLRSLFDDPLFTRRPHGLEPTRRALELAPLIGALIAQAEDALALADRFDPAVATRDFRIATLDYLAALLGPPLLQAFQREAPAARFALRVQRGPEALAALAREEVDIAVGQFQRPPGGFEVTPVLSDDYVLAARARHPVLGAAPLASETFERLRHVMISVEGDFHSPTEEPLQTAGLERRVAATAPSFPAALAMVAATDAVAVAPRRLARSYAAPYGLVLHELPAALPPIRLLVVRRASKDKGAAWLARLAAEALGADGSATLAGAG